MNKVDQEKFKGALKVGDVLDALVAREIAVSEVGLRDLTGADFLDVINILGNRREWLDQTISPNHQDTLRWLSRAEKACTADLPVTRRGDQQALREKVERVRVSGLQGGYRVIA